MTRRLRLETPLVFEPFAPLLVRRLLFLLILAPGILFANLAMSFFSGALLIVVLVVIALLSIAFCLFALDGIEGKVVVDAEGIEWHSPLKKKRLLWNDGLQLRTRELAGRSGVIRVYDVSSANETISFGENLRNHQYLQSLINTGINGRADHKSEVALPLPPVDTGSRQAIDSLVLVSVLSFIGAFVIGALVFEEARVLYFVPTVHIRDVAKYADKGTEIRVPGKLHTEPPAVSRDKQHAFGFQYVSLDDSTQTVMTIKSHTAIELFDDSDKLAVKVLDVKPAYFGSPTKTAFQNDWQNSEAGKIMAPDYDDFFKDFNKSLQDGDHQISVWSIEQDRPVEVTGYVQSESGGLQLQPANGSFFWLTPSPNKQLEQDFLLKAILMAAAMALGIFALVSAYFEAKRAE